jgi:CDGSH-type Zn-finger protein
MLDNSFLGVSNKLKEPKEYKCESCNFSTLKVGNWNRHLKTRKHNDTQMMSNDVEKMYNGTSTSLVNEKKQKKWICICGKSYSYPQGYYRHKKTCKGKEESEKVKETLPSRGNNEIMDIVKNLMTQNQELMAKYTEVVTEVKELADKNTELATENKDLASKNTELSDELVITLKDENSTLKDQNKNLQNNLNETIPRVGNGNITHNNNIDVNVFLEDKCKDAMHIQEFGELLNDTTTVEDIDIYEKNAGTAIGEIMKRELLKLAQIARPLHTYKKEWFVKDRENGWEKDEKGDFVEKIRSAVSCSLVYKCNTEKYADDYKAFDISAAQSKTMQNILKQMTDERLRNAAKRSIKKICTIK